MEPVSVSIILATVGWLVSAILSKTIGESWEWCKKHVALIEKIQNLIGELEKIQVLLEGARSLQLPSDRVHLLRCLEEVKHLVYEARDILDELDYFRLQKEVKHSDQPSSSSSSYLKKMKPKTTSNLKLNKKEMSDRIGALVKKLQERYEPLHNELNSYRFGSIAQAINATNETIYINRRRTTSYTHETEVYGRDTEINQILELIADGRSQTKRVPVISIVGNGGVGKTTLAQLIHNHPKIENQFDLRIWICVSTDFDDMRITREMLECCSADGIKYNGKNLNNLKKTLSDELKDKKVLLVLDDIWEIKDPSEWYSVLAPLTSLTTTTINSMVLVTTREPSIADMVKTIDPVIQLDGLDESSFWSLFKMCAFGDDHYEVPCELENIGRDIAKRLKGYPLGAKTVGALLKGNMDGIYWMEILENEIWKYQQGDGDIIPALMLSYHYLPAHLQRCFSYCSLFPKDYYFDAEELVHIWMAQGFIYVTKDDNRRIEDVGIKHLNSLVERAFFQTIGSRYVIHDLMHDLAECTVSKEEFCMLGYTKPTEAQPGLRHLSIVGGKDQYIGNLIEFKNLISLILIERGQNNMVCNLKWDQSNKARLLIIPYSLSHSLTGFSHLRYLRLSYDKSDMNFPVELCKFYHLEVLHVLDCNFNELPKEFTNLVSLRHFIAKESLHCKINRVGKLKLLQELKAFEFCKEENGFEMEQLGRLKELRGLLEMLKLENVKCREEAEKAKLSEKQVETLKLSWSSKKRPNANHAPQEDILEVLRPNNKLRNLYIESYGGCNSPSWLTDHSVKYLEYIRLSNCESWEELPNFGQMRFLKELHLKHLPNLKAFGPQFHGCSSSRGFPSLKLMEVTDMVELETWVWSEECEVFPSLENLLIERCPKLRELSFSDPSFHHEGIKWFMKLSCLKIMDCPQLGQVPPIPCSLSMSLACIENVGSLQFLRYSGCMVRERYLLKLWGRETTELHVPRTLDQVFIFKNFRDIRTMDLDKCPYRITSLSWKGICLLDHLEMFWINECPLFLLSPHDEDDEKNFYSQKSLQHLTINECGITGERLSWLFARLPAVRTISIHNCPDITSVRVPSICEPNSSMYQTLKRLLFAGKAGESLQQTSGSLMSLEELNLVDCPNMSFVNSECLSGLPALKRINIRSCEKLLSSMSPGWLPTTTESLDLDNVPAKIVWSLAEFTFLHDLGILESTKLTALDLSPFVTLKELILVGCKELALVKGPRSLDRKELFLSMHGCPTLVSAWSTASRKLDQDFLLSMGYLVIDDAQIVSSHAAKFMKSLRSLTMKSDKNIVEWTTEQEEALLLLTSLEYLHLSELENLRTLPVELSLHPSLKELSIDRCPEIKSLPEKGFPRSLQKLSFMGDCSEELRNQCSQLEDFQYFKDGYEDAYVRKIMCSTVGAQEEIDNSRIDFSTRRTTWRLLVSEFGNYMLNPVTRRTLWRLLVSGFVAYLLYATSLFWMTKGGEQTKDMSFIQTIIVGTVIYVVLYFLNL